MKHTRNVCALAAAITLCGAALAANHIANIAWSADGRYVHKAQVAAGKFVEVCGKLEAAERVRWRFAATAPLDFNIHYHVGKDVVFPAQLAQVAAGQDTLHVSMAQDHCWMWTNRSTGPVALTLELAR